MENMTIKKIVRVVLLVLTGVLVSVATYGALQDHIPWVALYVPAATAALFYELLH